MTITEGGYGGKPVRIRIDPAEQDIHSRKAALWIEQDGVKRTLRGMKLVRVLKPTKKQMYNLEIELDETGAMWRKVETYTDVRGLETLSYITLEELLDLKDEVTAAIRSLVE